MATMSTPPAAVREALANAAQIPLDRIKAWLCAQPAPWPRHMANEVEIEYRRLLALHIIHAGRTLRLSGPVAEFWRAHASDGRYRADCERYIGRVLDAPRRNDRHDDGDELASLYRRAFARRMPQYWRAEEVDIVSFANPGVVG
jgi:hypothetical protein